MTTITRSSVVFLCYFIVVIINGSGGAVVTVMRASQKFCNLIR